MSWPLSSEFNEAVQNPPTAFADPDLKGGETVVGATGLPLPRSGNFADVYQVRGADGRDWAVKCFTRPVVGLADRYARVSEALETADLPFTVGFTFLPWGIRVGGEWRPVVKMEWVEGLLLNQVVRDNAAKPETLAKLGRLWVKLCKRLCDVGVAHADIQHGNVILVPGSRPGAYGLKLIDYDGMYVPALANTPSGESGHPAYQHPARAATRAYSPDVDRFPHLVVATALRGLAVGGAALWEKYDTGDNLLFTEDDFKKPAESKLMRELWDTGDAAVQALVGRLALACGKPIPQTPWLDQIAPDGEPAPLDDATRRAAAVALGFGALVAVGVDWASPGESPAPASFEVVPEPSVPVQAELSPPPELSRERESRRRSKATVTEEAETDEAPTPDRSRKPADKSRRPQSKQQVPVWVWGAALGVLVCVVVVAVLAFRPKPEQTAQTKPDEEPVKPKDSGRSHNLDLSKLPPVPPKKEAPLLPDVALLRPGQEVTWDIAPGVKMVFCWIPPGKFQMGSDHPRGNSNEKPVHRVTITKGFWMAQTEVTQTQWKAVMGTTPSQFKGPNRPVESVSWNDCQNYCKKLTANLKGRATVCLPTEAEWEYACRAGTTTEYHFGDVLNTELANYNGNDSWNGSPKGKFRQQTTDAGSFSANPWGLYDMHGNVFEWCEDSYGTYKADDQSDPRGPPNAGDRVLRGGSWKLNPNSCRAATRYIFAPGNAYNDFGFRVCFRLGDGAAALSKDSPRPRELLVLSSRWGVSADSEGTPATLKVHARTILWGSPRTSLAALDLQTGAKRPAMGAIELTGGDTYFPLDRGRVAKYAQDEKDIRTWDVNSGKPGDRIPVPNIPPGKGVATLKLAWLSPNGQHVVVARGTGTLGAHDAVPFRVFTTDKSGKTAVEVDWVGGSVHFTADSKRLLVAECSGRCRWFDLATGEAEGWDYPPSAKDQTHMITSVTADGHLMGYNGPAFSESDKGPCLVNGKTGAVLHRFGAGYSQNSPVALSDDGRVAAVLKEPADGSATVEVVSVPEGEAVARAPVVLPGAVPTFALSGDGRVLVVHNPKAGKIERFDLP